MAHAPNASMKTISQEDLRKVLQGHSLWLRTHGNEGKQAKLSRMNLEGMNLSNANLRDAEICESSLASALMSETVLTHTDLRGTKLSKAINLTGPQLGGADLTCAEIDHDFSNPINCVNNQIREAGRMLLVLSALCSFALLTIASMTDIVLVAGTGATTIPGQSAPITTVGFYYAMPVIIFVIYAIFVLYLQRTWESLIKIPAVLKDGTLVCDQLWPWLPTGLLWKHYPQLRDRRPAMWWLQTGFSGLILWWIAPVTLHAFWARSLCVHDAVLSSILAFVAAASVVMGVGMSHLTKVTLEEAYAKAPGIKLATERILSSRFIAATLVVIVLYPLFSIMAFTRGNRLEWVPDREAPDQITRGTEWIQAGVLQRLLYWPSANVSGKQISRKPDNITDANLEQVEGPTLVGGDLRCIRADFSYLVNADLRNAKLDDAVLDGADLRLAKLSHASLQCAKLADADLRGADLRKAVLHGADMRRAKLAGADLADCDLQGADLRGTYFADAASEEPSRRKWGDAQNLNRLQMEVAIRDGTTLPPSYLQGPAPPAKPIEAKAP